MSLYKDWKKVLKIEDQKEFDKFWLEYSETEEKIYTDILKNPKHEIKGIVKELAEKFEVSLTMFTGFLDGVGDSLKKGNFDIEKIEEDSEINFTVDLEKLYFNMHKADAPHLYNLEAWEEALSQDRRIEIYKEYKKSLML